MKYLFFLISLFLFQACRPSPFLLKKYAVYNFKEEGFLTPDIMQTIGRSLITEIENGLLVARRRCLERALNHAYRRMIRVFLHTYFNIDRGKKSSRSALNNFTLLYPVKFSERDLIRGKIDFQPLLNKGFIALQDARSREKCTVIFRIIGKDMPAEIRSLKLTFRPENLNENRIKNVLPKN